MNIHVFAVAMATDGYKNDPELSSLMLKFRASVMKELTSKTHVKDPESLDGQIERLDIIQEYCQKNDIPIPIFTGAMALNPKMLEEECNPTKFTLCKN